MARVKLKQTH